MKTKQELQLIYKLNQERLKAQRAAARKKSAENISKIEIKAANRKLFTKEPDKR